MEEDFRENYFKARELVAEELIEKYHLIESYRDNDRLTLDSDNYSIHFTLFVPDGKNVSISKKGEEPSDGHSFTHYLIEKFPNAEERSIILKEASKNSRATSHFDYSVESIQDYFMIRINLISQYYPSFLVTA
jgi:hypothetical protein